MGNDEPLFDSMHAALTFAYRYSGQQYSPSIMAQMMRSHIGTGKGLSGLDGAAQAGLIRGLIGKLHKQDQAMISARFAADEHERIEAMLFFVPVVIAAYPTGVHSRRAADVLIQKWFGARLNINGAAEEIGVHRNTAGPMWAATNRILRETLERAEEAAFQELRAAGIIS